MSYDLPECERDCIDVSGVFEAGVEAVFGEGRQRGSVE